MYPKQYILSGMEQQSTSKPINDLISCGAGLGIIVVHSVCNPMVTVKNYEACEQDSTSKAHILFRLVDR